jgi:kynurenine aminotransferase
LFTPRTTLRQDIRTKLALQYIILTLSDEVYDSLYHMRMTHTATLSPQIFNLTLTVYSASKTFNATGWRVGFLIGPTSGEGARRPR